MYKYTSNAPMPPPPQKKKNRIFLYKNNQNSLPCHERSLVFNNPKENSTRYQGKTIHMKEEVSQIPTKKLELRTQTVETRKNNHGLTIVG